MCIETPEATRVPRNKSRPERISEIHEELKATRSRYNISV